MEDIKRMASDIFREYSSWASWLYVRYYRPNRMYLTSTNISIIVVTLLAGIVGSVYLLRKRRLEGRRMYEDGNEEDNVDMDRITDQWMKRLDLKLEDKMGKKDKKGDKTNAKKVNNEDSSLSRPQHVAGPANCPFNHLFGPLLDTGNVDGRDYHQLATAFPIMESLAKDGGDERNTMAELAHQVRKSAASLPACMPLCYAFPHRLAFWCTPPTGFSVSNILARDIWSVGNEVSYFSRTSFRAPHFYTVIGWKHAPRETQQDSFPLWHILLAINNENRPTWDEDLGETMYRRAEDRFFFSRTLYQHGNGTQIIL
ncbi:hypothetical protein RvY_03821-1 [Ramazzottius varieornatus]|uniref:Uncharacterized protein n=1 Tax=Ramazzottius varieornatus TaxID=947166 RepID=A0A1D1UPE3_RAMVA|nr:hypothetical protein RvY_03821-1 [Ramazzottius varieornatus]